MRVVGTLFRINLIDLEARTFNSNHTKHVRSILAICALTFLCAPSGYASNQENLKLLCERIQSLQKDLANKETLKQDTTDALQDTERVINSIAQKMNKLIEYDQQIIEEYKLLQTQHKKSAMKLKPNAISLKSCFTNNISADNKITYD